MLPAVIVQIAVIAQLHLQASLGQQAGFAHARCSRQQDNLPLPGLSCLPVLGQLVKGRLSSNNRNPGDQVDPCCGGWWAGGRSSLVGQVSQMSSNLFSAGWSLGRFFGQQLQDQFFQRFV